MTASLIDGKALAAQIKEKLVKEIEALKAAGTPAHLVALRATENPGAKVYLKAQKKSCEEVGIEYEEKAMPETSTQEELEAVVEQLNNDDKVTGVILMMPMPEGIDARRLQMKITPNKDVEGMTMGNMGRLVYGEIGLSPCTAKASLELLKFSGTNLKGKELVVVGHSEIVGKPLALMLLSSPTESPTVTVCHIATKDLAFHTKRADIIVVACGVPSLIKGDMVKEGVVVIDVGINRIKDESAPKGTRIVGDCDFDTVAAKAGMITPVPGGVGPVTTVMLLENTVEAVKRVTGKA